MFIEYCFEAYLQRFLVILCILTALQTSWSLFNDFFERQFFTQMTVLSMTKTRQILRTDYIVCREYKERNLRLNLPSFVV